MKRLNNHSDILQQSNGPFRRMPIEQEEELLRYKNFSYCVAKTHHKYEFIHFSAESRLKLNPYCQAYSLFRPELNLLIN